MEKIIYNFLDVTVGPGADFINTSKEHHRHKHYVVRSDNGTWVFLFTYFPEKERYKFYRDGYLPGKVSDFFCISTEDAAKHIRNWWGKRNNVTKIEDLEKFMVNG